jgi:hypothetical protein
VLTSWDRGRPKDGLVGEISDIIEISGVAVITGTAGFGGELDKLAIANFRGFLTLLEIEANAHAGAGFKFEGELFALMAEKTGFDNAAGEGNGFKIAAGQFGWRGWAMGYGEEGTGCKESGETTYEAKTPG